MRGELSSGQFDKRHLYDWYVEEEWVTGQLFRALGSFERERAEGLDIWDPAAGFGHTGVYFHDAGFQVHLSDIVERVNWDNFEPASNSALLKPTFTNRDFLEFTAAPAPCSIICNPPYSYIPGIAEAFVRHALTLTAGRVCMLVPNKWLAPGKDVKVWSKRSRLFRHDHPPQCVLHLSERPSMPPGDRIHLMGNRAFRGGMVDYCWIVWDVRRPTLPGQTRTVWLPPMIIPVTPIEGLA